MKTLAFSLFFALPAVLSLAEDEVSTRTAVEGNPKQEYFLIDSSGGEQPVGGYKLLLVLPGGDGSADFNPFVTNIGKHAAGPEYLVAQLIAVKWTEEQRIIWPIKGSKVEDAEFTTEEFLSAVIADVGKSHQLNSEQIYTLSWSSSGPAAYAASLDVDEIKGSFVAMSVFKPGDLSPLSKAKGHRYFIYHSPDDRVCPLRMAEEAKEKLSEQGAVVEFVTYEGGHGWHGNVFAALRTGIEWLASKATGNEDIESDAAGKSDAE